jgi:hypothetical protein
MKTTLDLDERLLREAQRRAADEGRTLDSLVEAALRASFDEEPPDEPYVFSFPTADLGEPMVDIADRKAVYEFLDDGA